MSNTAVLQRNEARERRTAIARLGRDLTPECLRASQALFAPLHESEPYSGVLLHRDQAYGPDPRHRLDVFEPVGARGAAPVLIYIHGGGFVRGDKKAAGLPFFDNIGLWAARCGFLGITATYRLAPQHRAPAGATDIGAVLAWVRDKARLYGGDPGRIVLMGHSAGAVHAACHVAGPGFQVAKTTPLAGLVLCSGLYDFSRVEEAEGLKAYFGDNYRSHSPLPGLLRAGLPTLVGIGGIEPRDFEVQALHLADALLKRDGRLPRFVRSDGQNHYTSMFQINFRTNNSLQAELERFIGDGV